MDNPSRFRRAKHLQPAKIEETIVCKFNKNNLKVGDYVDIKGAASYHPIVKLNDNSFIYSSCFEDDRGDTYGSYEEVPYHKIIEIVELPLLYRLAWNKFDNK